MARRLVSVRLDEELLALADEMAESRRSRTAVMEEALRLLWEVDRGGSVRPVASPEVVGGGVRAVLPVRAPVGVDGRPVSPSLRRFMG